MTSLRDRALRAKEAQIDSERNIAKNLLVSAMEHTLQIKPGEYTLVNGDYHKDWKAIPNEYPELQISYCAKGGLIAYYYERRYIGDRYYSQCQSKSINSLATLGEIIEVIERTREAQKRRIAEGKRVEFSEF